MKIVLVSCPQWSVLCPPYNLSLISSILQSNGHEVKVIDLNVECYHHLKSGEDYWEGKNYFCWLGNNFRNIILPKIEHLIDNTVYNVVKLKPDFVGVSLYSTNTEFVKVFIQKIKEKDSEIKIMAGGPECFNYCDEKRKFVGIDLLFTGEADDIVNEAVENYPKYIICKNENVVDLNTLPFADYKDYDLLKYLKPNSISMEASRGCIAKCSFCMETCFWSYRYKNADRLIEEIRYYKKLYDLKSIRFNDSLINGNIKQFKKFVYSLAEEPYKVRWSSYIRIDGRMDNSLFKKMKETGADFLSFGVESGSQKVLDDMKKGIKISEIEQNLRDSKEYDLASQLNWIIGFPTETYIDYFLSLIFIYNNRKNISQLCPGMTCGVGPKSDLKNNPGKYGIIEDPAWSSFITTNFENTIIHRFIRLKLFHIFLDILDVPNGQYHPRIKEDYKYEGVIKDLLINYDDIPTFKSKNKSFQSTLIFEYMALFWALYKISGNFKIDINFNSTKDKERFGDQIVNSYNSKTIFEVDKNKNWNLKLTHSLNEHFKFDDTLNLSGNLTNIEL